MNLRLFPVLLSLLLLGGSGCQRTVSTDFVVLAQKAYPEGRDPDRQGMDDLWISLFKLPQWHFLMTPASAETHQPAIQTIDNAGCVLAFTDLEKLNRYAIAKSRAPTFGDGGAVLGAVTFLGGDGGTPLVLSMTPDAASVFLAAYSNPAATGGVRFNEGAGHGWFAPLKGVGEIHETLKKLGKLDPPK